MEPNWDAIGAIGEIIGAGAVVISILYLAFQVRQNTRSVQGTTIQAVTDTIQNEQRWSSELSSIWVKVIDGTDSLSAEEEFRFCEWLIAAMHARQNEHIQFTKGLLAPELWHGSEGIIRMIGSVEWIRVWWRNAYKAMYTQQFIAIVDELFESQERDMSSDD